MSLLTTPAGETTAGPGRKTRARCGDAMKLVELLLKLLLDY
ncbi:hypothetical protein [Nesterenkonia sp. Act20]|nr:hypothetical protein [Nesterenkonia sp. Act20]